MYYRSGTDAAGQVPADASCSLTKWQHFVARNGLRLQSVTSKLIENPTPSIDAYLVT